MRRRALLRHVLHINWLQAARPPPTTVALGAVGRVGRSCQTTRHRARHSGGRSSHPETPVGCAFAALRAHGCTERDGIAPRPETRTQATPERLLPCECLGVTFEAVHEQGAKTLAREAAAAGVTRFVLVSGIGADPESSSPYIRARGRGERAVQQVFPGVTIVRPSAMFGPGDALFGTIAQLARLLPVLPLIGGGRTRLQPVYVEDVAEAIARILADPGTTGRTYEFAGPTVYTLRELFIIALRIIGKWRLLVPVPFAAAEFQARLFEFLPNPPLTSGQVDLLKADNVASGTLPGLRELNILPKAIEVIVPTYLGRSRFGV